MFAFSLSAGLLRQVTYTTTRLGIYNSLSNHFMPKDGTNVPFLQKAAIGVVAGGCGAMVGTPGDLALIRMMADGRLPVEKRRNYKNVGDALMKVIQSEGVLGMWKGCTPTIVRAMALNAAQVPCATLLCVSVCVCWLPVCVCVCWLPVCSCVCWLPVCAAGMPCAFTVSVRAACSLAAIHNRRSCYYPLACSQMASGATSLPASSLASSQQPFLFQRIC